jgi:hypothetical protein
MHIIIKIFEKIRLIAIKFNYFTTYHRINFNLKLTMIIFFDKN